MAILTAQRAVNTRDLPELKNVVNGSFANYDPDGGASSFDVPGFIGFQYEGPDGLFGNADDPIVEVFSTEGGTGDLATATQVVFKGTISSLAVKLGTLDVFQLTGFTPFDINDLYADATAGLPNFPSLLFAGDDEINGSPFADILFGFGGEDLVKGGDGDDEIDGGAEDDILEGGKGNDEMHGGDAGDALTGGRGADAQTGGLGADTFFFLSVKDSTKKASGRDTILDFHHAEGDEIDLSAIDARKGRGNQDFEFIGKKGFHDEKGELRYKVKNGDATVEGDTNGDGKADFAIVIDGVTKLREADFEL
jgi:Ca2+-binding RTX toxin-like protein